MAFKLRFAHPGLVGLVAALGALAGCASAPLPSAASAAGPEVAWVDVAAATPGRAAAASAESRAEADTLERALKAAEARVVAQQLALEAETYAREDAERRADEAAAALAGLGMASVERDTRGIVIALSGAELFDAGKATLLAGSTGALTEVANLLLNQNSTHSIVIHATAAGEGEGDPRLAASVGGSLAQRRADTVRRYFIARGVDASRISMAESGAHAVQLVGDVTSAALERPSAMGAKSRIELVLRPPSSATALAY